MNCTAKLTSPSEEFWEWVSLYGHCVFVCWLVGLFECVLSGNFLKTNWYNNRNTKSFWTYRNANAITRRKFLITSLLISFLMKWGGTWWENFSHCLKATANTIPDNYIFTRFVLHVIINCTLLLLFDCKTLFTCIFRILGLGYATVNWSTFICCQLTRLNEYSCC